MKTFVPARPITNPEISEESDVSSDFDEFDLALESDIESEKKR